MSFKSSSENAFRSIYPNTTTRLVSFSINNLYSKYFSIPKSYIKISDEPFEVSFILSHLILLSNSLSLFLIFEFFRLLIIISFPALTFFKNYLVHPLSNSFSSLVFLPSLCLFVLQSFKSFKKTKYNQLDIILFYFASSFWKFHRLSIAKTHILRPLLSS